MVRTQKIPAKAEETNYILKLKIFKTLPDSLALVNGGQKTWERVKRCQRSNFQHEVKQIMCKQNVL